MSRYSDRCRDEIDVCKRKVSGWMIKGMCENGREGYVPSISEHTGISCNCLYGYLSSKHLPNAYGFYLIDGYLYRGVRSGEFMDEMEFRQKCAAAIRRGMEMCGVGVKRLARGVDSYPRTIRMFLNCKTTPSIFYLYLIDDYLGGVVLDSLNLPCVL